MTALRELGLAPATNIFVTADHGFTTISKASTTSPAARFDYPSVPPGHLPPGFLAIDLAEALGLPLHEPSAGGPAIDYKAGQRPRRANAVIGHDPAKPDVAIAANGNASLIYLPQANAKETARRVVKALFAQDYVSGVFVDDALGVMPGTLPLSAVHLKGAALMPTPAIVVSFRSFTTGCGRPLHCTASITDANLLQGQGHHGGFSRADTANFMAAIGPAFKRRFVSRAPASNADVAPTLAHVLGFELPAAGTLSGRVLTEALEGGKRVSHVRRTVVSSPGDHGLRTVVNLQYVGGTPYFDAAGFPGRTVGLRAPRYAHQPAFTSREARGSERRGSDSRSTPAASGMRHRDR
jgi:arylsulfatase A-like enzyme